MPWPQRVTREFEMIPPMRPLEREFHASTKSADYVIHYTILLRKQPVFVLELKRPGNLDSAPLRKDADAQIRDRFKILAGQLSTFSQVPWEHDFAFTIWTPPMTKPTSLTDCCTTITSGVHMHHMPSTRELPDIGLALIENERVQVRARRAPTCYAHVLAECGSRRNPGIFRENLTYKMYSM
ncbi:hypothetical protein OG21DRAFT_1479992 [Imleria badia]|nr:hypothetical protein OG21DRAFT_1479992 [Imleria badia]